MSELFSGGGAAGAAMRAVDWAQSALGPPEGWPYALKAHVRAMLHTRQPISIFWGKDLVNLYNDGFLPILGDKHPVAMGQSARVCWADAWPVIGAQLESVMRGESVFHEEMLVPIARQGVLEDAWWNYSYSPLYGDDGEVGGVLVICTEITREVIARRELEVAKHEAEHARENLEGIFTQSPVPMIILTGREHRFTLVNRPYIDLVKRDVVGKTVREAFSEEEVGTYLPILDQVYASGTPLVVHESRLPLAAGGGIDERFIDVGYYPHRDANDAVAGVLVVLLDVTERVCAKVGREQAEAANRAKDEFLATVSHELRTPLTAILGWARLIAEGANESETRKGLDVIERNARAQAKLVDDILDVARIVSGKLELTIEKVDAAHAILSAIESVRPLAQTKDIRLVVEVEAKTPIDADEPRLQQIVWNLLANAVKFTPRGGTVTVRATERAGFLHFTVADTGRGISSAFLPHVFDRFRQHDASTRRHHAGLGLGLAIVRHLVELHGGTVAAESPGEGQGATFTVSLPIVRPAQAGSTTATATATAGESSKLQGKCVLVVDDHEDARELVVLVLESAGAKVVEASSVAEAFEVLAKTDVSAIVSDIGMPGEDGYDFAQRLRASELTKHIPAVALTAFARSEDRNRALSSGFQGHAAKPIDPNVLVEAVVALLR